MFDRRHKAAGFVLNFCCDSASQTASAVALVGEGACVHFVGEEAKMQNSQNFQRDLSAGALDGHGGERLAGSGFETEEPEQGFSAAELEGEE